MTTTDVAGLPDEIRAALARARIAQDAACDLADIARTSYYRRDRMPGAWRLGELSRLLGVAGADVSIRFGNLDLDQDAPGATSWRLGELSALAKGLGLELRLEVAPLPGTRVSSSTEAGADA